LIQYPQRARHYRTIIIIERVDVILFLALINLPGNATIGPRENLIQGRTFSTISGSVFGAFSESPKFSIAECSYRAAKCGIAKTAL